MCVKRIIEVFECALFPIVIVVVGAIGACCVRLRKNEMKKTETKTKQQAQIIWDFFDAP